MNQRNKVLKIPVYGYLYGFDGEYIFVKPEDIVATYSAYTSREDNEYTIYMFIKNSKYRTSIGTRTYTKEEAEQRAMKLLLYGVWED